MCASCGNPCCPVAVSCSAQFASRPVPAADSNHAEWLYSQGIAQAEREAVAVESSARPAPAVEVAIDGALIADPREQPLPIQVAAPAGCAACGKRDAPGLRVSPHGHLCVRCLLQTYLMPKRALKAYMVQLYGRPYVKRLLREAEAAE